MYVRAAVGLGQPGKDQNPEERLLRQVLGHGLQFLAVIDGRVRDIKLPPGVAHSPYVPKRHPESRNTGRCPPPSVQKSRRPSAESSKRQPASFATSI